MRVWAFLLAGLVAAFTGFSYVLLAPAFPRAAGRRCSCRTGLGGHPGRVVGYGVVAVAIASSAVIGLAFARYLESFSGVPATGRLSRFWHGCSAAVAIVGVKESVAFAAVVTVLEVGDAAGRHRRGACRLALNGDRSGGSCRAARLAAIECTVLAGAFVAFFAFIGFEDIVNMAEETQDAAAPSHAPSL